MYNTIALHVLHYTIAFKGTIIGTRGFSKDQLKGTLALKTTRAFWSKCQQKLLSFKLVFRDPPSFIILEPADHENRSLHLSHNYIIY